ncbi:MAG: hypothetical protein ABI923_14530 [bacterium]
MFERKHQKVASPEVFARRMVRAVVLSLALVVPALCIGIAGYHWIDNLSWVDSLLEASMILGGMGPVNPLRNEAAKIFASGYALFSGLMLIGVMGIILTPITHRLLHKFHVEK